MNFFASSTFILFTVEKVSANLHISTHKKHSQSNVLMHVCLKRQSSSRLQGEHQHRYQHWGKAVAFQWSKYPFEEEKKCIYSPGQLIVGIPA